MTKTLFETDTDRIAKLTTLLAEAEASKARADAAADRARDHLYTVQHALTEAKEARDYNERP